MKRRLSAISYQLSALIALGLGASVARAGEIAFDARVAQERIALDQTVELTVSLTRDGQQPFDAYRAPAAPDFDVLHTGTSEQMQFQATGGRQSVRMTEQHVYVLKPKKRGALVIGPATVRLGGQEFRTRPLTVHVTATSAKAAPGPAAPPVAPSPTVELLPAPDRLRADDELVLDGRLDKTKVYVGEQVTASWRLYTQSEILKYRSVSEPKHEDFWCEDLFVPQTHLAWDRQVVKGREFGVALLLKKALFPLKAGKLTVTPLEAEATTLQTAFYPNASGTRRSPALTVEVLPLPASGRPPSFEAPNVGRFTLEGALDRTQVKAGEAIMWTLTVRGTGNIRNVKLPKLAIDGFKAYEPTTHETLAPTGGACQRGDLAGHCDDVHGEKVYRYLLLPLKGGALTLPSVELAYFDPQAARYQIARTKPVELQVVGDPSKLEAASSTPTTENVLAPQVRPIRNKSDVRSRIGVRLWRGKLAWVFLASPPGLWLVVLLGDGLQKRLAQETARSKRRRARSSARKRLRVAEYHIRAQRPPAFFGECARVLYEHLEYRLGGKVEALTLSDLRGHLESRGFDEKTADAVVKELENCDFARFAPSASGPGEMRAALRRVKTLLDQIEKVRPIEREKAA